MSIIGNPFLLFLTSDNKSKQIVAVNYSRHIIFSRFLTAKGNTMQLTVVPNDNVTDGANVYSASMDVLNEHNPFNGSQNDDNGNQVTATVTNIDADGTYTLSADSPINGKRVLAMSADEIASRQQASQPQTEEETAPQAEQKTQFQEQTEQQGEQDYETMQPEQAFDKLVADMGGATIAVPIATAQMEQAKAELDKLQKKAPKLSGTPAEMKQALSEHNAKIADAQRKLDAWTAINAVPQQRKAEEQKRIREENDRKQAEASAKAVAELEQQNKREAEKKTENVEQSTQPKMTEQSEESKIIQPIGESDFGFVYNQFKGDAQGAIRHLTKKQEGEALGALHHKDIGDIDLVWGYAGTRKSDGYGLAKLVKFHPEVLDNLQEIIGNMRVVKRSDNRIQLEDSKYKASVRLSWNGADKTWLLTAFMKKEMSEPTNSSTGVVSNPKGLSDDIATRQSIDISDSKDSELSQKSKEDAEENKKPRLEKADSKTTEVSSTDALLRDAVADVMRESGIKVITDNKEAQRVLDRENKKTPLIGQPNRANEKPTSGSVLASIRRDSSSNPTTSKQADTKIKNDTQSAKNKIKKYFNGDFLISNKDINQTFADLGKMFAMQDKGGSRYSILQTNGGKTIAIRISNHNAKGDNFKQDNADSNLSIVIEQYKYDNANDSNVEYTEVTIPYEAYRNKPTEVIDAIVNGVNDTLADKEFSLSSELGTVEKKGGEQANTGNKKVRFFRTANGEAYGFTVDGKIYLDPTIAGAETAIHEYTHLWATALKNANPKEWSNIVSLLKGTPLWEKVASEYPELTTDDELADEVLAHYSGKRGAERLRNEAERIANGKGSLLDKAGAISALERVKEALTRFWKATADLLHIHFTTAEEVADKVLADLLNGVNPNEVAREYRRKQKQLERINETNPMLDNYHVGIRGLSDILTMREAIEEARQEAEEGDYETLSAYPDITNEMLENALQSGKITVYSSKPIKDGNFVTPSRMQAEDYAGDGRVYSKTVSIDDVAWINTDEGQFVKNRKDKAEKAPLRFQFIGEQGAEESRIISPLEMSESEKSKRRELLQNTPALNVASGQIVKTQNLSARKSAEIWWERNITSPLHYQTEIGDVVININSIGDSLAHGYSQAKLDAITSLKHSFRNAVYLGSLRDFTRNGNVLNHYFAYPILYNGNRCYVFCRAMHDANKNQLYVHEVFVADKIEKGNALQTAASKPHGGIALYKDILANILYTTKVAQSSENPSIEGENLYRKPVGGNSGYVGYSMSKRAEQAREDGRFPKTDFKREYKVSESSLQALSRIGIISDNEWHHTSSYGNKTTFYGWADEAFAEYYLEHKKEIDKATDDLLRLKEEDIDKYFSALDDFRKEMRKSFDVGTSGLSKSKYDFEQELRSRTSDEVVAEYQRQKSEYTSTESNPKPFPSILKWQSQNKDLVKEIENKVRQEMDQSSAIVDSVMSLAGKLHLDNVEIVTDTSALSSKEAKAKGFYSKSTGKITIVIPNNTSAEDAVQTLLHEAVAHYGMGKIMVVFKC